MNIKIEKFELFEEVDDNNKNSNEEIIFNRTLILLWLITLSPFIKYIEHDDNN